MNESTAKSSNFDLMLNFIANSCALAVMAIGMLVISGWISGIDLLTRLRPEFESMKFNTALSFVMAGVALRFRENAYLRITIGITLSILGALILSEYALEADFGIDQTFINDTNNKTIFPGRMSPATAVCFLLSGLILSSGGQPTIFCRQVREILALTLGIFGLLTLLGYLLSEKQLYQLPGFASVSLPTGFAFLILSIGMLSMIEESLLAILLETWRSYQRIWLGFFLLMFFLAVTGIVAVTNMNAFGNIAYAEVNRILLFGLLVFGMILAILVIKHIVLTVLQNESTFLLKQNELLQSRMDFARAQEVGQIGWWRLDTAENILTWSDENYRIFCIPKKKPLSYDTFLNLVHPDDRQFVNNQWMAALRGYPYDIEHRVIAGDQIKWVREKAYLEFDEAGLLLGGFGITQDVTKRKQVEIDLINAQESLSIALEAAQMGTWDLDITRDFSGHRSFRHDQIFGYDAPQAEWGVEIARRHVIEEDRKIFDMAFAEAKQTGKLKLEVRVNWPDGSIHWLAARGRFYFDGEGNPVRGAGVNYDITEHKHVEQALAESETRVRRQRDELAWVYQNAPIGLCELDLDLRFKRINQLLADINGLPVAAHIGKRIDEIVPALSPFVVDVTKQILATGRAVKNTEFFGETLAKPGVMRHWNESWFPVLDEQEVIIGFGVVVEEITQRKQIEEALRTSEERSRLAQSSAHVGIWDWHLASGKLTWTFELERLYGYEKGTFPGQYESFLARVHPEDIAYMEKQRDEAVYSHQAFDYDFRILLPSGQIRWVNSKGGALYDRAGRPERILGVNVDITERRLAEEALIEADRRKNEFIAMLGHELRNPLTPIANIVQTLNTLNISQDEFTRCLKTLERNIHHITQLVDDLLDISRITQGAIRIRKQRLELASIIEATVKSIQSMIDAKKQTLHLDLPAIPVFIDGDPVRLTQILTNLLNNAVKYTGEGGRIELSAKVDRPCIAIRVKDNGMGIAAELLPKIFDLFTQSERGLSRSEGGLGIGLALVKQLVELHGGEISAQSQGLDQGSEFTIHLPLCVEKDLPLQLSSLQPDPGDAVGSLRILLIDDNADVTASLALWLEQEGHQIKSASNGSEGLLITESFQPDIVILDIGLPDMDGYDLAWRLRSLPSGSRMLLIAMSGYAPDAKVLKESPCSIDHYLIKPPRMDQLRQLIADLQKAKQA